MIYVMSNQNFKSDKRGFTLVELMIVISIISILSVVGMAIFSKVLQNGRDLKRVGDLKNIQSALEQYRVDQLYYPQYSSATCSNGKLAFITNCPLTSSNGVKKYLDKLPTDPLASAAYPYVYTALPSGCDNTSTNLCNNYCLYAAVENSNNYSHSSSCSADSNRQFDLSKP